ncbi:hypothetical protein MASR2M32_25940 [Sphaerotilus sulfidivorans]
MRGAARIAILIDGGFFLKRLPHLVAAHHCDAPIKIAACIRRLCRSHVKMLTGHQGERWQQHLHRIYCRVTADLTVIAVGESALAWPWKATRMEGWKSTP